MSNLFAHTDDLVVPILIEWLDFADVARLDLACSVSKNDRGHIYRLFAAPQVVFHNNTKQLYKCFYQRNKRVLLGLVHRKIKLAKFEIDEADSQLVETYISQCGQALQSLEFSAYNSAIMSKALISCPQLKELIIHNGAEILEDSELFSESIETLYINSEFDFMSESITMRFPNLRDLHVVGYGVFDGTFVGIVQHTTKLQRLSFDDTQGLTATSYAAIGQYCHCLERLSVYDMSFSSGHLVDILPFTPLLKELILRHNENELDEIEVFEGVAAYCPKITDLTINNCKGRPSASNLTAFAKMLVNCVHLCRLDLQSCTFVTDEFLEAIASQAKHITSLCLTECSVSDVGLAHVAKHCTELKDISCSAGEGHLVTEKCKLMFRKEVTVELDNTDARNAYIAANAAGGGDFLGFFG